MHPITARRGKWVSETMSKGIEKLFGLIHRNTALQKVGTIYQIRNGLIVRLNIISFVAQIVPNQWFYRLKIK